MAPSASSNVNPQPGRLTPDQAIALGEVWSFLLHLWYCEPAHPGGRTNSHVVDDPYSLPTSPTTGSKWKSSGISSILVPTVEEKPSDATILPKLSPLNTCYYYLHRHLRAAEKTAAAAATEPATPTAAANPKSDAASLESELCETLAMRTMLNRQSAAKLRPWPSAHRDFKFKYTPAVYHDAFWAWVQNEHPDSIVIRSLKACRWKPIRAMEHLMLALEWRITHFLNELCLLEEDALDQRYNGFKYLLQRGTVAAPGYDLQGRPIHYCIPSLDGHPFHFTLKMLVFYWAEHIRLLLKPPNDFSSGLLDLSKLAISDVKLASPKFIMHAECNYGQMMGIGATFKPPWMFYAAWKLVAPLMDARIRQSVKFLSTYEELEAVFGKDIMKFMQQHGATDSSQCDSASDPSSGSSPKHSTSDKWRLFTSSSKANKDTNESKAENHSVDKASPASSSRITSLYTPPVKGENDLFHQDSKAKQQAIARRKELELAFEEMTMTWLDQLPQEASNASTLIKERDEMGYRLVDAFWVAEPYTRVRSVLHRLGNIKTPKPFFPSPDSGIEADSSISASDLSNPWLC